MKAPNKIYAINIAETIYASNKPQEIFGEPYSEYIRKDALLEWAKEKLQERHAPQFRDAIGQLIDELNSM